MSQRAKFVILAVLGAILALTLFYNVKGNSPVTVAAGTADTYLPIAIENPALHLDRIERLRKLEYKPTGRDIFTAELPPPPKKKETATVPPPKGPDLPPEPPPLVPPFKYYGFSDDAATKKRRGFFTNGEEVFIAAEGELVQGKFRILTLSNSWADVEEVSSSRHARLNMESPGGSPPGELQQR
jgi:hypothetical protein